MISWQLPQQFVGGILLLYLTELRFTDEYIDNNTCRVAQKFLLNKSRNIRRNAGRPRSKPIFDRYRKDKAAYRHEIGKQQRQEKEICANELHEVLFQKQSETFRKCWRRKFERNNRTLDYVNGVTDHAAIAEHFVSHFERACTANIVW